MKFLPSLFIFCFLFMPSMPLAQEKWIQYTSGNYINCLAAERDYIWAGTNGGVVKWNRTTGEYTKYTTLSGLADNYVKCIAIDLQGNKWFGTGTGVSRFDGEGWTSYSTNDGLLSNTIYSITVDKYGGYGKIVCGTPAGLSAFDGRKWSSTPMSSTPLKGTILSLAIDTNGKLWVGTPFGLWQNYRGWISVSQQSGNKGYINGITPDLSGNVWVGTRDGIVKANDYGALWYDKTNGFPGSWVPSIAVTNEGAIWFADYSRGVIKFSGNEWTQYSRNEGFPGGNVNSVIVDSAGSIWCGTSKGICEFDGKAWKLHMTDDKFYPSPSMAVNDILTDNYDNVWVWTNSPAGKLMKFDGAGWTEYGLRLNNIAMDGNGNFWICANDTLKKYVNGEWKIQYPGISLREYIFFAFTTDDKGNLWVGGEGGISRFDGNAWTDYGISNGLPDFYIEAIQRDSRDNIWVGTTKGAAKFDGTKWTTYNSSNGLTGDFVWVIYADTKGNVWIGTSSGVSMYDGANWTRYTKDNSPVGFSVHAIGGDAQGTIWVGGLYSSGVYKFDGNRWTTYTPKDGLASSWVQDIAVDGKGNTWFNTWGGVSVLMQDSKVNIAADTISVFSTLQQNYPNPFNLSTFIPYKVENSGQVSLSIYNALGQRIRTLVDTFLPSGAYIAQWDGRNSHNIVVPSGVYFYRLNAKGFDKAKPMLLLK